MVEEGALSTPHHETYEILDRADEEEILAELSGRVTDKYVYTFKQGGQEVPVLSKAGVDWACREYARQGEVIRIIDKEITPDSEDPEYIYIVITAQRFVIDKETLRETPLDSTLGVKRQWRKMRRKKYDGGGEEVVEDPFFFEKGVSKAIRNAKRNLMPTDFITQIIAKALANKNGKTLMREAKPAQQAAPPPPQQQQPATQPAPQAVAPSAPPPAAPARAAAPKPLSRDVMIQKFDAALKGAFGTSDTAAARQGLGRLTGNPDPGALDNDTMKTLGNVLLGVIKKQNKLDGDKIVSAADGKVLWQKPAPPSSPHEAPPPQTEEEPF